MLPLLVMGRKKKSQAKMAAAETHSCGHLANCLQYFINVQRHTEDRREKRYDLQPTVAVPALKLILQILLVTPK